MIKKKKRKNTQGTKNTSSSTWFTGICENPTTNIIFHGRNLDVFPSRSGIRQGCPLLQLLLDILLEVPVRVIKQEGKKNRTVKSKTISL